MFNWFNKNKVNIQDNTKENVDQQVVESNSERLNAILDACIYHAEMWGWIESDNSGQQTQQECCSPTIVITTPTSNNYK